ncbi:nucleotide exchange factor GrpE [Microlunatus flavus]|uniref:Protein GrpE n=1 Tax=Microlunatus flavus TaxID=1036181 RepID=A0A1H9L192_9ACTN|nr:nucleotide exchange factor GrpE [Microlunatus flavus]SER05088.1 molecular chaperone GrpE [Microlunatus flavus]
MSDHPASEHEGERTGPTVRDRRRIDPETFEVREPQSAAPAPAGSTDDTTSTPVDQAGEKDTRVSELETALAERTADLQRLQAEYVNYKRRVDRDRDVSRKTAVESVLKDLLPALDDIRSAGEHGELTGAFKAVGDAVTGVAAKHGLVSFGEKGDTFDPHVHEALLHSLSPDVTGPTCVEILQPGYRVGERVLRPARVAVAEPDGSAPAGDPAAEAPGDVPGQPGPAEQA